ncbi:Endoplasmic reticulum mannosyl-oligosaccharide 1,2-alpha-mannosidase [Portunus trituberculatus]|uniref:mannosyl-oligosaccharide 1,2-alpha-mannosidase n=1 Tax=Portunus trituberculatus TaxID=210409 RepID=A0A5B7GEH9_PORTR|nr:Endoplasmic reticulum mannosyl-oligosaccharide 1,2-alpha-mannosidase [Portunus trituberculatus]
MLQKLIKKKLREVSRHFVSLPREKSDLGTFMVPSPEGKYITGIEKYCKVENGYTSIGNVRSATDTKPKDKMESFFLGETLKYLYLLFMEDQTAFSVDKWVFNSYLSL